MIWSTFEIHVSIICACLPLIPGLLRHYRGNSELDASSNRLGNGDRGRGGSGNLPLRDDVRLDGE